MQVQLVQAANAILGEGPLWCPDEQVLYWIDILRPAVYRHTPGVGQTGVWALPESVGSIARLGAGQLLVAMRSGLFALSTVEGSLTRLASVEHASAQQRLNDSAVDPAGRFWVGSMREGGPSFGKLYRFGGGSAPFELDDQWACPNGIGWSPDGTVMYVTDSAKQTIWRYAYSVEHGTATDKQVFATFDAGTPDGLTVDAEGCVWSALWDGWSVVRLSPEGERVTTVPMPVQRPTSVAFGGDALQTLYVTSASINVDTTGLNAGPLAGGLFAVETSVRGLLNTPARLGERTFLCATGAEVLA
ncbi:SMP-30/gluconolactonase/LRE family protein [Ralstonia sp. ASV6]|uniref:SMP-30/gluconolactonase/LRE family protein n=1 Tax=Ralstonia sp. ASV6 TaxID=2795124 RepID=UPI0018EA6C48|nr:SMP-30/gluconolactonase/LRE family protein [Ralstonia sp. ASV6]